MSQTPERRNRHAGTCRCLLHRPTRPLQSATPQSNPIVQSALQPPLQSALQPPLQSPNPPQVLLDAKVQQWKDAISSISTEATQEMALEELLAKVQNKWVDLEFNVMAYKDSKDVLILGGIEDVQVGGRAGPRGWWTYMHTYIPR